ncbi:M15 family metallopeptidase [Paralimibaculum aggregatum]|uniref:M15 family metallopeptidase n=1 Tax=Paralimibaculum aggregatum TaxID=3036245 RepID=A0ABQ6LIE0_9RHOB|nr:M15 family metallopeptidase [Limibaculum sp. NKW23]GMG82196.1 M15 family metallopeptidase [Limibaculum sp. NKW23]
MNAAATRLLESELAAAGLLAGPADGRRDRTTDAAAGAFLAGARAMLPAGWQRWSGRRRAVAALQLVARGAGLAPGRIDGLWGPLTEEAVAGLAELRATGRSPRPWRDALAAAPANPNGWPLQTEAAMTAVYGPPGQPEGRTPPLVPVECPWELRLAWDLRQTTRRIHAHAGVAESLARVLARVRQDYLAPELRRLRLDRYGGCYNPRRMRGGSRWSTHAWGIALDFDPERNRLRWGRDRAALAGPAYDAWWAAWEAEGWVGLGRARNFDWMHVQAARLP